LGAVATPGCCGEDRPNRWVEVGLQQHARMLALYLGFNAVLYAVFAAWCACSPRQTADFIGLVARNPAGESEYLAVYGGLQAGLAVFYGLALALPDYRKAALLLSVTLYGGIVALRTIAVLRLGFADLGNARYTYGLEITLLLLAVVLMVRGSR
jgi:hypothetical protein